MSRVERRRFLSPRQRGLTLSPQHGLSLGDSFKNLALVAPTGSGKTTRYVIPNVLAVEGSVLLTDPSGEIFAATSGRLHERGFRIQVLQPADLSHSLRFNPLHYWRTPQELRQLASILAPSDSSGRADPFWTVSAVNLLYLVLSALVNVEDAGYVNLANLRWLLNHLGGQADSGMHAFMSRYLEQQDPRVFSEYLAFCATEPKVTASIIASARAALELWSDPEVCRFTANNTVDLEPLRHRHTAIFLIVPEHQVRYFSMLLNLFYSACFAHCLRDIGEDLLPVFFFLDEFGNIGHIQNFASIITTLRKRRCSVSIILQALSQLDAVYGRDAARTIFSGGCANKLFFSGLDLETAHYVERMLGVNTEYDTTFGGIDDRARTIGVPLLSADRIRMLPGNEGILISGRERPAKLEMPPYFQYRPWHELAHKPPVGISVGKGPEEVKYYPLGDRDTSGDNKV